jgi:hypothetical protein
MIDTDYDGLADHLDNCPTLAERYNKFQDDDGCPDSIDYMTLGDTDGDGIFDDVDMCPEIKETYNKFQDEDGCPDRHSPLF